MSSCRQFSISREDHVQVEAGCGPGSPRLYHSRPMGERCVFHRDNVTSCIFCSQDPIRNGRLASLVLLPTCTYFRRACCAADSVRLDLRRLSIPKWVNACSCALRTPPRGSHRCRWSPLGPMLAWASVAWVYTRHGSTTLDCLASCKACRLIVLEYHAGWAAASMSRMEQTWFPKWLCHETATKTA